MTLEYYTETIPKQVNNLSYSSRIALITDKKLYFIQLGNKTLTPISDFDWADDVEETLQQYELLKPTANFDWADDVEDMFEEYVESDTDMSSESENDTPPDLEEYLQLEDFCLDKELDEDMKVEQPTETVSPWEISRPSVVPHVREDSEDLPTDYLDDGDQDYSMTALMKEQVNCEFGFRDFCMELDEERQIHHFNWFGCPVYEPSGTPPAISLFFQLSEPKVPTPEDELRFQSIFTRAKTFIDPVIVESENSPEDLYQQRFELVKSPTSRTSKFYSLHGRWTEDPLEQDECKVPDEGNVELYQKESVICGNGFVSPFCIRPRCQWEQYKAQLHMDYESSRTSAWSFQTKRQNKVDKGSPLRQSMNLAELECTADNIKTHSENPTNEQECFAMPADSPRRSAEQTCHVHDPATDVADPGEGLQQTNLQCLKVHTVADQVANIKEVYEAWSVVDTVPSESSRSGMDSTAEDNTWEIPGLDRASKDSSTWLGSLSAALTSCKSALKRGRIAKYCRLIGVKARKVLHNKVFVR
ncbi:hypothetical protein BDV28DRAFT_152730 [Aspergillus coremiiformis]|uniref:Uncharacterized protein n=1 Tax=Aspergillus coremiiformis TaxID=138285 RepID=A0A5N6YSS0_9EURO|nr:hypothetical protein BDV28DRAFT_152730 [Aspergillus coremiiformis]